MKSERGEIESSTGALDTADGDRKNNYFNRGPISKAINTLLPSESRERVGTYGTATVRLRRPGNGWATLAVPHYPLFRKSSFKSSVLDSLYRVGEPSQSIRRAALCIYSETTVLKATARVTLPKTNFVPADCTEPRSVHNGMVYSSILFHKFYKLRFSSFFQIIGFKKILRRTGMRCADCGYSCHVKCIDHVSEHCSKYLYVGDGEGNGRLETGAGYVSSSTISSVGSIISPHASTFHQHGEFYSLRGTLLMRNTSLKEELNSKPGRKVGSSSTR